MGFRSGIMGSFLVTILVKGQAVTEIGCVKKAKLASTLSNLRGAFFFSLRRANADVGSPVHQVAIIVISNSHNHNCVLSTIPETDRYDFSVRSRSGSHDSFLAMPSSKACQTPPLGLTDIRSTLDWGRIVLVE